MSQWDDVNKIFVNLLSNIRFRILYFWFMFAYHTLGCFNHGGKSDGIWTNLSIDCDLRRSPLRWWPRGLGVCHSHLGHAVGTGCLQNLESMPKKEGKDEVFEEMQIIPSYTLFQFPQIFFDPVPFRYSSEVERRTLRNVQAVKDSGAGGGSCGDVSVGRRRHSSWVSPVWNGRNT